MREFLIDEWKTILAVTAFCCAVFGWFYLDEMKKANAKAAPHVYSCIQPGKSYGGYTLGSSLNGLPTANWTLQTDELGIPHYTDISDKLTLGFRDNKLASIQIAVNAIENDNSCMADIQTYTQSHPPKSRPIEANNKRYTNYNGLIRIEQKIASAPPNATEISAPNTETNSPVFKTTAWLIVNP